MQPRKAPPAASGSSVGRTKGRVTCQVTGCLQDLTAGRESYTGRYRVCPRHMVEPAVVLYANQPKELYRFCNQCFKFEKLAAFDGTKRGCRMALARRRERSRLKRLAISQNVAPFPGQLLASAHATPDMSPDLSPAASSGVDHTSSGVDAGNAMPPPEQQPLDIAEEEEDAEDELPGDLVAELLADIQAPRGVEIGDVNGNSSSLFRGFTASQAFPSPEPHESRAAIEDVAVMTKSQLTRRNKEGFQVLAEGMITFSEALSPVQLAEAVQLLQHHRYSDPYGLWMLAKQAAKRLQDFRPSEVIAVLDAVAEMCVADESLFAADMSLTDEFGSCITRVRQPAGPSLQAGSDQALSKACDGAGASSAA
eukprot:gene2933-3219_t